jgi:hypothetical protein
VSYQEREELLSALDLLLAEALDSSIRQLLLKVMARLCLTCIRFRLARERAQRTGTDNGQGPAEEEEWPGEAAGGRFAEPKGAQVAD